MESIILKLFFASILFPALMFMIFMVAMAIVFLAKVVGLLLPTLPVFMVVGILFTYIVLKELTE